MQGHRAVPENRLSEIVLGWILLLGLVLTSFFISLTGKDVFRLPKELAFIGTSILLGAAMLLFLVAGRLTIPPLRPHRNLLLLLAATLSWSLLTALVSVFPPMSFQTLRTVIAGAVFVIAVVIVATSRRAPTGSHHAIPVLIVIAAANGALALGQRFGWHAIELVPEALDHHLGRTGWIGNPNLLGSFLVVPTISALALLLASRKPRERFLLGLATLTLFVALIATETRTAVVAILAGVAASAMLVSWRRAVILLSVPMILLAALVVAYPSHFKTRKLVETFRARDYDKMLSGRLVAFAAAERMIRERPLFGWGPGTFPRGYFLNRGVALEKYPALAKPGNTAMFMQAHNDHLEIMAEAGLPGYFLFLSSLVLLGQRSFGRARRLRNAPGIESRFAAHAAFPLAVSIFVLCLGQFPLQTAAPRMFILYVATLVWTWSAGEPETGAAT